MVSAGCASCRCEAGRLLKLLRDLPGFDTLVPKSCPAALALPRSAAMEGDCPARCGLCSAALTGTYFGCKLYRALPIDLVAGRAHVTTELL